MPTHLRTDMSLRWGWSGGAGEMCVVADLRDRRERQGEPQVRARPDERSSTNTLNTNSLHHSQLPPTAS